MHPATAGEGAPQILAFPGVDIAEPDHVITAQYVVERYLESARSREVFVPAALAERVRLLGWFAAHLGDRDIRDCVPDDLASWIDVHAEWKSAHTKRHKCQQVQACFNWFARMRKIPNPFAGVVYPEGEPRAIGDDDTFQLVLRYADLLFRQFLVFMRHQGCRPGEVRQLEWAQVNLEAGYFATKVKTRLKKSKKPRLVPLVPVTWALLRLLRRRYPSATGPIFRNQKGSAWTKEALDQKFARMRERLGIQAEICLHGFRHGFGTAGVRESGQTKLISLGMGHSSQATTERYYLHLDREMEAIREAMATAKPRPRKKDSTQ